LLYVDADDQAVWTVAVGDGTGGGRRDGAGDAVPRRITPAAPEGCVDRYGEMRVVPGTNWLAALRERHGDGLVVDEIVAVDMTGVAPPVPLASGRDLYAAPRPSPDARFLAYLAWDLPAMPWESSELWVVPLHTDRSSGIAAAGSGRRVAGGPTESVGQPEWNGAGGLLFVSDAAGWWQPHRLLPDREVERLSDEPADFHAPDWAFGQRTMAPLADATVVARVRRGGRDELTIVGGRGRAGTARLVGAELDLASVAAVQPLPEGDAVAVLATTPTDAAGLYRVAADGATELVHRPAPALLHREHISVARHVSFPTTDGSLSHALFFGPRAPGVSGPEGDRPPLVVFCHGGPTGSAEPGLDLLVQWWTTRGLAVAVVDYRGSSGYGRAYREALRGRWGEVDASDCRDASTHLVAEGLGDGRRMLVRGSSSGGLTALRALGRGTPFAAAVTLAPVTDLAGLVETTHKFESGYFEGLVGPWPEEAARYEARSPARHPEDIEAPVLLFQGADDPVVPPAQARALADAVTGRGGRCELVVFAGEGHGFRRADSLAALARHELAFVGEVLGLQLR
ncbi:MAG TPA: prolyl oligopeptidase family serine peptidase, partial [Acidimicrobiales bacterium]|nr:prolyl oligopeptidase family serine peptidase [Acidimicrobiales bacterium]